MFCRKTSGLGPRAGPRAVDAHDVGLVSDAHVAGLVGVPERNPLWLMLMMLGWYGNLSKTKAADAGLVRVTGQNPVQPMLMTLTSWGKAS